MNNINRFLRVMNKLGYPNPNVMLIAESMNYNLDEFLVDLIDEIGEVKTHEFVERAFEKLSEDGKGIRVPLDDNNNNYIYLQIYHSRLDGDETEDSVLIDYSWGENKLTGVDEDGNEYDSTMDELYDNIGMGEWGEWDEMIDNVKNECYDHIRSNCGFGIWFDNQQ